MLYARLVFLGVIVCTIMALGVAMGKRPEQPSDRERFDKLFADGNFKDAYDGYRRLALEPKTEPNRVGTDLKQAIQCLNSLGRIVEKDEFLEAAIAAPPGELAAAPGGRRKLLVGERPLGRSRRRKVPPRRAGERPDGRSVRARSCPCHPASHFRNRPRPL